VDGSSLIRPLGQAAAVCTSHAKGGQRSIDSRVAYDGLFKATMRRSDVGRGERVTKDGGVSPVVFTTVLGSVVLRSAY
jgi:hypothetical protein